MGQKLVRVPFDIEMAKKITSKEVEGKIVTRDGRSVRIMCWDVKDKFRPILALIMDSEEEKDYTYFIDGMYYGKRESEKDLMLEIPGYMTFKDGDILSYDVGTFILERLDGKDSVEYYAILYGKDTEFDSACFMNNLVTRLKPATEEEKKKLIDALKATKEPQAKEYLKRFFGIEQKKEYEFKPKDWVLCKTSEWVLCQFSHKTVRFDGVLMYVTV